MDLAGFLYGVCTRGHYDTVKIGYTSSSDPEQYVYTSYSRAMVPLQIIAIVSVANAKLMEKLVHYQLHPQRVDSRHEVFHMAHPDGTFRQDIWDDAIRIVQQCDAKSGLALPQPVQTRMYRNQHQQAERRQQKAQHKAQMEAQQDIQKRQTQEEQARRVEDTKAVQKEKYLKLLNPDRYATDQKNVASFLVDCCEHGIGYHVFTTVLLNHYRRQTRDTFMTCATFEVLLRARGVEKRTGIIIDGKKGRVFIGIRIKQE